MKHYGLPCSQSAKGACLGTLMSRHWAAKTGVAWQPKLQGNKAMERQTRVWSSAARGATANMRQAAPSGPTPRGPTDELPAAPPRTHTGGTGPRQRSAATPSRHQPSGGTPPTERCGRPPEAKSIMAQGHRSRMAHGRAGWPMGHLAPGLAPTEVCSATAVSER